MLKEPAQWKITCDNAIFEASRKDERFPFIVALARAMNALNFAHSPTLYAGDRETPDARRDRLNSYFLVSAILYEVLKLVETMHKVFKDDPEFQNGLRLVAKDKGAETFKQDNLDPLRNGAVFHFLPGKFAETLNKATCNECSFIEAEGMANKCVYYPFADVITAEMLVGVASDDEVFDKALIEAMQKTRDLVLKLTLTTETLIIARLKGWGFRLDSAPEEPVSPESPPQG